MPITTPRYHSNLKPTTQTTKLEALEPKSSEPEEVKARLDDLNGNGIYAKQ
jgi:hypothetical protein